MKAAEIAAVLAEIALLSELNGGNAFRARAFAAAARSLETSDADLERLAREDRLTSLPGIGSGIAETIRELVETGRSALHEELRTATPIGLFEVLRIPGLGPKRIHQLHEKLGIDSLDSLEVAAEDGSLAALPGFGAKTANKVLAGVAFVRQGMHRRRFPEAQDAAVRVAAWLRARPGVTRAEITGQVRRCLEVVDSIELLAEAGQPAEVAAAFDAVDGIAFEPAGSACVAARLADGFSVRIQCVDRDGWAAGLLRSTGSEAHLAALGEHAAARGLRLDGGGLFRGDARLPAAEEPDIYAALGLAWIEPELREGMGEIERAAARTPPRLIEITDLRGVFHCHTTYSDGKATLDEMAEAALARGWSYLGLADHSRSAAYAGGLSIARIQEQHCEVDGWHGGHRDREFRIFKGIESDILADGRLDYPDEVLAGFDYVVGSVHSGFGLAEAAMTERVVRAVSNPFLTMLGHPTGRLLLTRGEYPLDVRAVLDAAAEHGVVVEINANPHRLDLDWRHVRYAAERGILIAINPDAHSAKRLDDVLFGINVARKGGLEPRQVLNTWTTQQVEAYFAGREARIQNGA